ncbi:MAG: DNA mismatch repair endonuclease MutL [Bacteroidetes bacterium]|jgi:DNA mismatch repair protein MutL|nr:DNA mismatch repair endonuclease MutL [Bacteroidota bacterium]
MPATIHIMPPELANKIAAGEVVQRPASAVKELIENALDAGARRITVHVKDAGRAFIQVSDDGSGMSAEDAALSIHRHATSKVLRPEDLERIGTFGFRGEALASISAVSQLELRTRTALDDVATVVRVDGDTVREVTKAAAGVGTTVIVKNLFYNTPARRNFLKTRQTELKNIADVVTRAALAHPTIAWLLVSDDETFLDLRPGTSQERVSAILGERVGQSLMPVEERTDYLSIEGFLARPEFARRSRTEQYLTLNRRPIQNKMIAHAIFQGYEHLLINGGFPLFVLDLTIDPARVDVNVHPSKLEVKFEQEGTIYRMVLSVIRKTLAANDLVPRVEFRDGNAVNGEDRFHLVPDIPPAPVFAFRKDPGPTNVVDGGSILPLSMPASRHAPAETVEHRQGAARSIDADARAIWQIQNKYIVSQVRSGLVIVDQHVAHERILYERVLANFENSLPAIQQLLFPQTLELTATDYALVRELEEHLRLLGFDIKLFGKNTVVIEGIPADVKVGNEKKILLDVLEEYKANEHAEVMDARDRLAKSFACKAAIKAGDPLTSNEMTVLIEQLFLTKMPYVCPHGRPVVIRIPIEELDRRFGRT